MGASGHPSIHGVTLVSVYEDVGVMGFLMNVCAVEIMQEVRKEYHRGSVGSDGVMEKSCTGACSWALTWSQLPLMS